MMHPGHKNETIKARQKWKIIWKNYLKTLKNMMTTLNIATVLKCNFIYRLVKPVQPFAPAERT